MTPGDAIKILRYGVDGMGNEGGGDGGICLRCNGTRYIWGKGVPTPSQKQLVILVDRLEEELRLANVQIRELEKFRPAANTLPPARQSGSPEVDPSGERLKYLPCPLVFKGKDCGYTGSEQNCNKTYESCRDLLNLSSFRGWPIRQLCGQDLGPSEGIIGYSRRRRTCR